MTTLSCIISVQLYISIIIYVNTPQGLQPYVYRCPITYKCICSVWTAHVIKILTLYEINLNMFGTLRVCLWGLLILNHPKVLDELTYRY